MNKSVSTGNQTGSVARTPFRGLFTRPTFEDLFNQFLTEGNGGPLGEAMSAAMDVAESDQAFEVKMDLPGVKADDVDIQIDNNTLTVKGRRSEEKEEQDDDKHFHRIERYSGSFSRSVLLPGSINEDETIAEFKDGVLNIIIPKTDDARPRKIKVKG